MPGWVLCLVSLLCAGVVLAAGEGQRDERVDDPQWTDRYDSHFRKHAKHYFGPLVDWRWFKAQAIVESGLDPKAKGPQGSVGIMQIQPKTFRALKEANPHFTQVEDPNWNIAAGIYYNRSLYRLWMDRVPATWERLKIALASYNAGYGNIRTAARRAGKPETVKRWAEIERFAPSITRAYVRRISTLMGEES